MKTRICVVRHGETSWNAERRLQGHTDIPLNENGRAQAEATAEHLDGEVFDALYTSDLMRAHQTASACGRRLGLTPITEPGLRERHFGVLQGLTYDEARQRYPVAFRHFEQRDPEYAFEQGGESLAEFADRIRRMVTELAARHAGGTILLVAHGGVLDTINRMVRGVPLQAIRDFLIPNAALNWIEYEAGAWRILTWAQQSHLGDARDELPNA